MSWAAELHSTQTRKGAGIPYVSHLMAVCSLVLEDGGSEDEAIAALLHDAIEDQGVRGDEIEKRFGADVRRIVDGCTEDFDAMSPKPPWRERKEAYLEHLSSAETDVLRVSLADKSHNLRTLLEDLDELGPDVWSRFNAPVDEQLWFYRALAEAFKSHPTPLARRFTRMVARLEQIAETDLT